MKAGRLHHVAVAVSDLDQAVAEWCTALGFVAGAPQTLPDHGVRVVMIDTGAGIVELMEPLDDTSPVAAFLRRNPKGGLHHICFLVPDIDAACEHLTAQGMELATRPATGAHGNRVVFLKPRTGVLIELEEES